jgi:SAM-dependent methyltransferase
MAGHEEGGGVYGTDLAAAHAAGFTALARAAARTVLPLLPARARVVDLGCGDGTTAAALAAAGHDVLGIDSSPAQVALARERAPGARFEVASFLDAQLPEGLDAVLAIGEVLGYLADERTGTGALDELFARVHAALRPGGVLLFDLAGPGRVPRTGQRSWADGDGWAVLYEATVEGDELVRRIATFTAGPDGTYRRTDETHRLLLHRPEDVLLRLFRAGFAARVLHGGYDGEVLPGGWHVVLARPRA